MATISLKTVYQTLYELADLGEVAALNLGTGTVRFDPNVDAAHHHLVCRSCGKVRDLNLDFKELSVPGALSPGLRGPQWPKSVFRGPVRGVPAPRRPSTVHPSVTDPDSNRGKETKERNKAHA